MRSFQIEHLTSVVILGATPNISEIVDILDSLNLHHGLITSPAQENLFHSKHKPTIFKKLDQNFVSHIVNNYNIDETLFVSIAARWIFKEFIFRDLLKNRLVNFHGTRLPLDSGGGGFSWRIMRADRIDNQLVHLIDKGVDTGNIIFSKSSVFPKQCITPIEIEKYHRKKFLKFFKEFCTLLIEGYCFTLKPQQMYLSSYYPRLSTLNNGYIDWSLNSDQLIRFINAFDDPYPGALTFLNGDIVHIKNVQRHGGEVSGHPFMRGLVIRNDGEWIIVRTSDEFSLIIEKVIDSSGRNIVSQIKVGDRLFTSQNIIDGAIRFRARFGPNSKNKF